MIEATCKSCGQAIAYDPANWQWFHDWNSQQPSKEKSEAAQKTRGAGCWGHGEPLTPLPLHTTTAPYSGLEAEAINRAIRAEGGAA